MTTPYTLTEAYSILRAEQKNQHDNTKQIPVDIMGFIKDISITENSAALAPWSRKTAAAAVSKCQLWLVDDSCSFCSNLINDVSSNNHGNGVVQVARFCLYGSSEITKIRQENLQVGDLLRFNNVALKEHSSVFPSSPYFQFSSLHPDPGMGWCCLGSFHAMMSTPLFVLRSSGPTTCLGTINNNNSSINAERMMTTCPKRIKELTDWFIKIASPANILLLNQPSSSILHLSPLPCRQRLLEELQMSAGIQSNIQVCVTHLFSQPATVISSFSNVRTGSKTTMSKRRKLQYPIPQLSIATVADESGVVMALVDSLGRFHAIFKQAMMKRSTMLLVVTHVWTKTSSSLRGGNITCSTNEIVLMVTSESMAFLISKTTTMNETPWRRVDTGETQTQVFGDMPLALQEPNLPIIFVSEVLDVIVDGISLRWKGNKVFSSTKAFREAVLTTWNDGRENDVWRYHTSAKVRLQMDCNPSNSIFSITSSVLNCLCGGLDARDLVESDILCQHSLNFIQALIQDTVKLKWTVDSEKPEPTITKAVLHS
jgi:hypothetical protein